MYHLNLCVHGYLSSTHLKLLVVSSLSLVGAELNIIKHISVSSVFLGGFWHIQNFTVQEVTPFCTSVSNDTVKTTWQCDKRTKHYQQSLLRGTKLYRLCSLLCPFQPQPAAVSSKKGEKKHPNKTTNTTCPAPNGGKTRLVSRWWTRWQTECIRRKREKSKWTNSSLLSLLVNSVESCSVM